MLTQKGLQELLLHQTLGQQDFAVLMLLQSLNEITERLEKIENLLEKRERLGKHQMKEVRQAMLAKVENQLTHLEKMHQASMSDLKVEVKSMKQALENTKSKFIGFQ
jgi:hypothetical protein